MKVHLQYLRLRENAAHVLIYPRLWSIVEAQMLPVMQVTA